MHIRRLTSEREIDACVGIMATSEPWVTLGRTVERSRAALTDPEAEVYVALASEVTDATPYHVLGFLILIMRGAFVGYIRTVAVHAERRSGGVGSALIAFAEQRVFRESPNVFICVSSFNPRARVLYERLGYSVVGELTDYIVRGHSEWLLRKTIAPLSEFQRGPG